jgi:small subunit ribosomal protein S16
LGTYDPHAKTVTLNKERAAHYLEHGAQPSERVVTLFKSEGIDLPKWVSDPTKKAGKIRNPEKLRRNRPEEPKAEESAPVESAEAATAEQAADTETPATDNTEKAVKA